tara:strand:- start:140 stop:424 length:285 start_codon:yes stop_codon:yes gene_type:complete
MIKLLINWGSYSAWTLGAGTTALDIMGIEALAGIPTDLGWFGYLSMTTFILAAIAKTVNLILNGIQEREGKRLENVAKHFDNRLKERKLNGRRK